jgi:hypothetical protein
VFATSECFGTTEADATDREQSTLEVIHKLGRASGSPNQAIRPVIDGTQVKVIQRGFPRLGWVQVRFESGDHVGQSAYIPESCLGAPVR